MFRLTFSDSACLSGFFVFFFFFSSFLDFFFTTSECSKEKRPCLLSLIHSFIHAYDLSRNNIWRRRRTISLCSSQMCLLRTGKKNFVAFVIEDREGERETPGRYSNINIMKFTSTASDIFLLSFVCVI